MMDPYGDTGRTQNPKSEAELPEREPDADSCPCWFETMLAHGK